MQQKRFDLNTLNGTNGFKVPVRVRSLTVSNDISASTAGDLNGDGLSELVLGVPGASASYVIFGSRRNFSSSFNLTTLDGTNGFTVLGVRVNDQLGSSVSTAGDLNGDGLSDLVLGSSIAIGDAGASYVIFGRRGGFPLSFNLTTLDGTNGFNVSGIAKYDQLGWSVSTAGDINGDGLSDLVLGAIAANSYAGASYVIFGNRDRFSPSFNLMDLNGTNGFAVPGITKGDELGWSVSTAGDFNGDGIDDLLLGAASNANSNSGASYVIFGSRKNYPSSFNLTTLDGTNGFIVPGLIAKDSLGSSVNTAGDLNGDGIGDLVLGANGANSHSGASYVIFGSRRNFPSSFNLNNLNGTNGFTISGLANYNNLGSSVSTAGDLNGDGIDDLLLGALNVNYTGASYVIFGSRGGFPPSFNVTNLNGTNGFIVPGIIRGGELCSISMAGDFNGDGASDFVLGSFVRAYDSGESYLIFGKASIVWSVNQMSITQGQSLTLTDFQLNATYIYNSTTNLVFTVSNVQGGHFEFVSNPGTFVTNFTQQQINSSQVRFVSDRTAPVAYNVGVTNGLVILPPRPANVTFINHAPIVVNIPSSQFVEINQSFHVRLQGDQIFNDTDGDSLTYTATLSDGSPLPAWMHFDASQPNQLDFTGTAPFAGGTRLRLFGQDTINASVNTQFDLVAKSMWVNNQMVINQGQSLVLTNTQLDGTGLNDLLTQLVFTVSNVQGGHFEFVSNPGTFVTNFTQQQINSSQVRFVSDRTSPVAYNVGVTNGQFTLPPTPAKVTFTNHAPTIINIPSSQFVEINQSFYVTLQGNQIFNDSDGDSLTYAATLSDGSPLPTWMHFDASQTNQLDFTGKVPFTGVTRLRLLGQDPINASISTQFDLVAKSMWVNNQMVITQGQSLVLTNTQLDATGLNDPLTHLVFTVSNVQGGRFELVSNSGASLSNFTQQQINTSQVRFVSDRTAPVAYNVGVTNGQFTLPPVLANVTFTNHAPIVINIPSTQVIEANQSFHFTLQGDQIFNDMDGDSLNYTAKLTDGSPLPSWICFDGSQSNQLNFSGTARSAGGTRLRLWAQDPIKATANTDFEVVAAGLSGKNTVVNIASTEQIMGGVIAGVLGLGAAIGVGLGFWHYATNKNTRSTEQFADFIQSALNLKNVDNFNHQMGTVSRSV